MEIALMFSIPMKDIDKVTTKNGKMVLMVGNFNGVLTGQTTGAEFSVECVDKRRAIFHASYVVSAAPRKCQQTAKALSQIAQQQFGVQVHAEVYK